MERLELTPLFCSGHRLSPSAGLQTRATRLRVIPDGAPAARSSHSGVLTLDLAGGRGRGWSRMAGRTLIECDEEDHEGKQREQSAKG